MRKHLIFILLMSLQMVAHGQTMAVLDSLGLPRPTVAKSMRYWFDDDAGSVTSSSIHNSHHIIDVSALAEGLHTINYQIIDDKGSIGIPYSSVFLKLSDIHDQTGSAVEAKKLIYWFDDDNGNVTSSSIQNSHHIIDVSALAEGLHTINYQIIDDKGCIGIPYSSVFLKLSDIHDQTGSAVEAKKLIYWFDEQEARKINDINGEVQMLDASALQEGMHTLHYMVVCSDGSITSAYSSIFLSLNVDRISGTSESINAKSLRYWFDENDIITETKLINGTQSLDVSNLSDGFHMLHYQIIDNRGEVGVTVSSPFIKLYMDEEKGNAITRYMYWLNDKSVDNVKVNIDEPTSPYQLISLLPMPKAPIRSSSFHFEPKNGEPMIYAKNDVHFRFFDAAGYWGDEARSYIDYNVSQKVTGVAELASTQTFERPEENGIKWFKFEAEEGDSIGFYCNQATSLQVFAPSGEEIYSASEYESLKYGGTHTWEDGTHYVAVHDVTGSRPSVTLNYMHMDKFDVVDQDVRVVGNEGASTITYYGNGFKNLYSVDYFNEQKDTIQCVYIEHISDAEVAITTDFNRADIGTYNAVFHFTEEDRIVQNSISVEPATDIALSMKVSFADKFLKSKGSSSYVVNIMNHGNMTAYRTPIFVYVASKNESGVSRIKIDGLNLHGVFDGIEIDSIPESDRQWVKEMSDKIGDNHYFVGGKVWDSDLNDSIYVRTGYFFANIAPCTSKRIEIKVSANETIDVWVTCPKENNALSSKPFIPRSMAKAARRSSIKDSYCCIRSKVECIANLTADVAGLTNTVMDLCPGCPYKLAAAAADCVASSASKMISTAGTVMCDDNNVEKNFWDKVHDALDNTSTVGMFASCASKLVGGEKLKALLEGIGDVAGNTSMVFGLGIDAADCVQAFFEKKPNCPPNPDNDGGESTPVNSLDPNDIYGYVAHSGSKYISEDIITLPYRIEFENDTTFATASAHTVIVKDTLDATKFDLSSYTPTSIKIGDKDVQLNGDKQFVTTIDMRPSIDAIAQVEGTYDEKKGIATWKFTSLDPMTMEETDDVMQGFLPINHDGNGIGEVAFSIDRLANLADGADISNKATIVFDSNDAIETPVWTNTIDAIAPTSKVTNVEMKEDSKFSIHFDGEDARSGIWKYDVYYRWTDDMDWIRIANGCDSTAFDKEAVAGYVYQFCVVATDMAGNVEPKSLTPEFVFSTGMLGDVNGDGKVTVSDAVKLIDHSNADSGKEVPLAVWDVNNDGNIDLQDAVEIIKIYLNNGKTQETKSRNDEDVYEQ